MDASLASLFGAVIGGGIASGSNLGVERYRDRRQQAAERTRRNAELRRSSRLLAEELAYSRELISKAEERRYFTWEPPKRELPASAWSEHRASLAERGSLRDWRAVVAAYNEIDRLNWLVRDAMTEEGFMGEQLRAPWEGPALVPASEFDKSLALIDDGVAHLAALDTGESREAEAPTGHG